MDALVDELPAIKSFATLSPIPGFANWLRQSQLAQQLRQAASTEVEKELKQSALRLVAQYLNTLEGSVPIDAVARFHLGNGASVGRINWAADLSAKGLEQSCGLMVNYLYEPDKLDANRLRLEEGNPSMSREVQRLL